MAPYISWQNVLSTWRLKECLLTNDAYLHHLNLNASAIPYDEGMQEDFVAILSKEDLQVFNAANPWPANALKGDKAVLAYLGFDKKWKHF